MTQDKLREAFSTILAPAIDARAPYAKAMLDKLVEAALASSVHVVRPKTVGELEALLNSEDEWDVFDKICETLNRAARVENTPSSDQPLAQGKPARRSAASKPATRRAKARKVPRKKRSRSAAKGSKAPWV